MAVPEDPAHEPEEGERPESEIADARLLFQEDKPAADPKHGAGGPAGPIESTEVLEIDRPDPTVRSDAQSQREAVRPGRPGPIPPRLPSDSPPLPPVTIRPSAATAPPERGPAASAREREFKSASDSLFNRADEVDPVWTRRSEWGPSLIVLGCWSVIYLSILYVALMNEYFRFAFAALILGGLYWFYLSYPILITLEIPVRLTPESAVRDYYGALSHHMPHHRRMWLLLSREAKATPYYGSFEGFRAYWKGRIDALKEQGRGGRTTPLQFQIDDFRAEQSADKSTAEARFTVRVFVRGRRDEGAFAAIPVRIILVRGSDQMWYLGDGILPDEPR